MTAVHPGLGTTGRSSSTTSRSRSSEPRLTTTSGEESRPPACPDRFGADGDRKYGRELRPGIVYRGGVWVASIHVGGVPERETPAFRRCDRAGDVDGDRGVRASVAGHHHLLWRVVPQIVDEEYVTRRLADHPVDRGPDDPRAEAERFVFRDDGLHPAAVREVGDGVFGVVTHDPVGFDIDVKFVGQCCRPGLEGEIRGGLVGATPDQRGLVGDLLELNRDDAPSSHRTKSAARASRERSLSSSVPFVSVTSTSWVLVVAGGGDLCERLPPDLSPDRVGGGALAADPRADVREVPHDAPDGDCDRGEQCGRPHLREEQRASHDTEGLHPVVQRRGELGVVLRATLTEGDQEPR